MIAFLLFWGLPLLGCLVGTTLALVWREHARSPSGETSFELVSAGSSPVVDTATHMRFLAGYFEALDHFIRKAEKSIIIVDYLAHHRSLNAQENQELLVFYEKYYLTIEKTIQSRNIKYVRVAQLPLPRIATDRNEKISESLSLMFAETAHHIDRLLDSNNDFTFYILNAAFRPYSFIIVDDAAILTEYDRYTGHGTSVADHIIINEAHRTSPKDHPPQVMELIRIQRDWCLRLIGREKPVTLKEFRRGALAIEQKDLKAVEVQLALSEREYTKLIEVMLESGIDKSSVRSVRLHGPEDIRSNALGSQKKLQLVGSKEGAAPSVRYPLNQDIG